MKKYLFTFIIFILVISITLFFTCESEQSKLEDCEIIISSETEEVTDKELKRVEAEVRKGIQVVCQQLDIIYPEKILVKITKIGICRYSGWIIYLPILRVKNKEAGIVHEITHVLAMHGNNRFFSEGIAICLQEKYGEDNAYPNFDGLHLDDLLREYKNKLIPLTELNKNNDIFYKINTEERRIALIEAGSFISFLLTKYGNDKLKELHNLSTLDYKNIYGINLEELEIEWKNYIFN